MDSNIYKESSGPSITNSLSIGLSEYTNANFFSDDTIYKIGANAVNDLPYPELRHPDTASECYDAVTRTTNDHNGRPRVYYLKNGCGENNGGAGYFLAAEQYFASWQTKENSDEIGDYSVLGGTVSVSLDDLVYQDYARLLFPRAIGYSKGLLDYFFRGRMEISPIDPQNLIIRGNGSGRISIFKITASVRNATMDHDANNNPTYEHEEMGTGKLLAVAKYQVDGISDYSVSKEIIIDQVWNPRIDATSPIEFSFDFSEKPIPWNAEGIDFQVIFRGTLGNEKDMAVAVGRRPLFDGIMEITPPSEYVYSIIDASTFYSSDVAQPQFFNTLKASLRNQTATKEIQTGTLTAIASYRRLKNYQPDMAGTPPTSPSERGETITYSISEPISIDPTTNTVNSSDSREFILDFSNNPIPAGITDLYLFTVFEGTLHDPATNTDAPDSVVVGIKDLNEPQHLTYWNDTDYFLLRGYPRKADDIRNDPDVVRYGCFVDPHNISESVKFFSINNDEPAQELVNFTLPAGNYSRIIVLSDTPNIYSVADTLRAPDNPLIPPQGFDYEYEFARTINQLNSDGLWYNSPVLYSRGIRQHDRSYFINVWPALFFRESVPVPDNDLLPVGASIINFPQP